MSHQTHHLVHANIAIARAPLGDPIMEGFTSQVDEINAIAQRSPGFVSQPVLPDEGEVFTGNNLLNLSVWKTIEDLERFTHQGKHAIALERRAEWFEQPDIPNYALFWVVAGHTPSGKEVKERIEHLRAHGPTPYAFTFEQPFTIDDVLAYGSEDAHESAPRIR